VRLNVSAGSATTAPATTAPTATTPARPVQPGQPATATVPDVQGKTLQQARLALRKAGIVMAIRYVPSDQSVGTVVAQAKQPGTTAKRNAHMLVTVSQGGSGGTSAATLATVPNVVGTDEQTAQTRVQQAGFSPVAEDSPTSDSSQDGRVVDEQPAPGAQAPKGSQIIIYVGRVQSTG
jgi:serine/threonine-protein kinase